MRTKFMILVMAVISMVSCTKMDVDLLPDPTNLGTPNINASSALSTGKVVITFPNAGDVNAATSSENVYEVSATISYVDNEQSKTEEYKGTSQASEGAIIQSPLFKTAGVTYTVSVSSVILKTTVVDEDENSTEVVLARTLNPFMFTVPQN